MHEGHKPIVMLAAPTQARHSPGCRATQPPSAPASPAAELCAVHAAAHGGDGPGHADRVGAARGLLRAAHRWVAGGRSFCALFAVSAWAVARHDRLLIAACSVHAQPLWTGCICC